MHVRALATLLLLAALLEGSAAGKETQTVVSLPMHAALESQQALLSDVQQSLSGDPQKAVWGREAEDGRLNHSGTWDAAAFETQEELRRKGRQPGRHGRGLRKGREGRDGSVTLGTLDPNDNLSVTIGLDSMFNAGTSLLSSLVVVAAVLGVVGIGAGVIAAVAAGWKYYDKNYIDDFSSYPSYPSFSSSSSSYSAPNALPYDHHEDAYNSYRRLEEGQAKYGKQQ